MGAAVAAIAIYVWVKVLNPKVKSGDALKAEYEAKAKRLLDKAWEQMAPLNALFDSDMTRQLVQKTIPIVKIDRNFTVARYAQLRKEFGYAEQEAFTVTPAGITTGILPIRDMYLSSLLKFSERILCPLCFQ